MNCTCSLLYLLKNKDNFRGNAVDSIDTLETASTSKCINDPDFNQMVADCKFEEKITECNKMTTPVPVTTSTTNFPANTTENDLSKELASVKASLGKYKTSTVFFVIFTIILIGLFVCIIVFPAKFSTMLLKLRGVNTSESTESIQFTKLNDDISAP